MNLEQIVKLLIAYLNGLIVTYKTKWTFYDNDGIEHLSNLISFMGNYELFTNEL